MKKSIIIAAVLCVVLVASISFFTKTSYPYELKSNKLETFLQDLSNKYNKPGEFPDNSKAFALENKEYAITYEYPNTITKDKTYSVTIFDTELSIINQYTSAAQDELSALNAEQSNITVNKFFGGQKGFVLCKKTSNEFKDIRNGLVKHIKKTGDVHSKLALTILDNCKYVYISPEYFTDKGCGFRVHPYTYAFPVDICLVTIPFLGTSDSYYTQELRPGAS